MSAGLVATGEIKTFIEDGWIEEVLFQVKGGKEANVYCCRACPGRGYAFFALKVYKPRKNRSFPDAAIYQEGRVITKPLPPPPLPTQPPFSPPPNPRPT